MESATLTWPGIRALDASGLAKAGFALLCAIALVGFLVYPTYPNYDSYYSMLWGREALHLHQLSFVGYRHPTEHPLAIAVGGALSLLGDGGDRVWVGLTIASFLALAAGLYRLGRLTFGPVVGAVAVVLLMTRFNFPFLAVRGYIDIPFLAIVVWAAAWEVERPRRGVPVFGALMAASLLRPEAWVLIGLYFLWCFPTASWRTRLLYAALTAVGPVSWAILDAAVTGDALFSLHSTSGLAEELGRAKGLSAVPAASKRFLLDLDKAPIMLGGLVGGGLALWYAPRRAALPIVLLGSGVLTFGAVGVAGLSVIERYLLVPSVMVMIFAAVAIGGWTMLREGSRVRLAWKVVAAALVVFAIVFSALRLNPSSFETELRFRGDAHAALTQVLRASATHQALHCGPVSVPTHKLVPDVRWILDRGAQGVVARADPSPRVAHRIQRGVAIVVTGRDALARQVFVDSTVDPIVNLPPAGFHRIAVSRYYAAYARC